MEMAVLSNGNIQFVFSIERKTPIGRVEKVSGSGFRETQLLEGKPRQTLVGGVLDRIQVEGICYGEQTADNIDRLFELKAEDKPVVYTRAGINLGRWILKQVRQTEDELLPNGSSKFEKFSFDL